MPRELISFFQALQSFDYLFLGIVAILWLLLFYYNLQFYLRLALYKIPPVNSADIPLSVLMVERNEEANLAKNLPGWLSLDYPAYEIVVVDDFSEDNSVTALGLLRLKHQRLRMTCLNQETRYSQKLSRSLALKAASYDHVVFGSPSMEIPDHQWLNGITAAFSRNKTVIIGYSGIVPLKGFYNRLFRIESFLQQIESMAFCLNGLPFVATEENISFLKREFFDINGFGNKIREEYLNMELIINSFIRKKNNSVLPAGDMALLKMIPVGKQDYVELLRKSFRLKSSLRFLSKLTLGFFNLLKLILLPAFILCVILYPQLWIFLLALLLLLVSVKLFTIKRLQRRLNEKNIFISSLIYGLIVPYYKIIARLRFNYRRKNL
jgi:glycosyltransferase involved in cell wall biosynthesis